MKENQDKAQDKQKEAYAKRKSKGVKTFDLKVGDQVLKKNMRNLQRKGGATEPLWAGPYRYGSGTIKQCRIANEI